MKKKILVVEDDVKAAQALGLRLRSSGYEVLIANDGNEGLILARDYAPDLVVTDIWMPVGMGFSLAYRLREFAPKLPILFVTGSRRPGVQQAVKSFGATRLLEKPYTPRVLFAAVAEMLGESAPVEVIQPVLLKKPYTPRVLFAAVAEMLGESIPVNVVEPVVLARARIETPKKAGPKKILIVEDDRKIGLSLCLRLKSAGYVALLAEDALMGVSMAVKNKPDLVILDISMPAGNGFTVAERIRALFPSATPIIFLTASKQPSFRAKAAGLGAAGFFEKPFKSNELLAAIEAALVQQTSWAGSWASH